MIVVSLNKEKSTKNLNWSETQLFSDIAYFILLIIWIILILRTSLYGLLFRPLGLWILAKTDMKAQRREALFWHLECSKAIKNQWLGISPFPRHHSTYCHFLIVLKTLASKSLPLLCCVGGPGIVFHRTWQHLSWTLLPCNCMLPCGVRIRHTSGFMAHCHWRSLWTIQIFFSVWFTNRRSPSDRWGWNNVCRDELLIFPNACSTNQARAAMCFSKENLPYLN